MTESIALKSRSTTSPLAIRAYNLYKVYNSNQKTVALDGVNLEIPSSSFVSIVGVSGSGKSTLLHLLAGLDQPTKYDDNQVLVVCGQNLLNRSESWLTNFRARHVGFVLQFFGLLPTLTVLENVMLAGYFGGHKDRRNRAEELLASVGLNHRLSHFPSQISGGERQRVAIARSLVNNPDILFADEPTGNLDSRSGQEILDLLREFNLSRGITIIIVSHDNRVKALSDRVIELLDGQIVRDISG
ncbi:MAG: ABC transporter ATP-binding protein [Candidatus Hodarchaeales archaeon]|jgi:putative ABC transport system ATP-binding protein